MTALALVLTLLTQADPDYAPPPLEEAPVVETAPVPDPDVWAGEHKRVHFGFGLRAHVGLMTQLQAPVLLAQSGLIAFVSVRTFGHQEAFASFELSGGLPDTVAGETLLGYRFHLTPRFSVGAGMILLWGFWSMRAGLEVPFTIRIGDSRRHELGIAVRGTAGAYNNSTFVWWDFEKQRTALTVDAAVTYAFIF